MRKILIAMVIAGSGYGCAAEDLLGADAGGDSDSFTLIYESSQFQKCVGCHAPGAAGFVNGTEATANWTTRDTAYAALQGNASGLIGNFAGCNGVPLIGDTPETSLVVAVFDQTVRADFTVAGFPDCDVDSISDMTLKINEQLPAGLLTDLKAWITAGAPDK